MNELKHCPFCGREAVVKRSSDFRYYVMCGKCEVKTHKYIVKSDAIKNWNRRANVNESKHGKWSIAYAVPDHNGKIRYGYQCSKCEAVLNRKTNFCGNCGAKMDGKDGGEND